MKRSEINKTIKDATSFFTKNNWALPPNPKWDITDFGLGNFEEYGLVLINLSLEKEYSEKLLYSKRYQKTPSHCHAKKKEDIIVRVGIINIQVWNGKSKGNTDLFTVKINGEEVETASGHVFTLKAGERVTLEPGIYHEFYSISEECVLGEVSTRNDDINDNFFMNEKVGRFSKIEEDELPIIKLLSD